MGWFCRIICHYSEVVKSVILKPGNFQLGYISGINRRFPLIASLAQVMARRITLIKQVASDILLIDTLPVQGCFAITGNAMQP